MILAIELQFQGVVEVLRADLDLGASFARLSVKRARLGPVLEADKVKEGKEDKKDKKEEKQDKLVALQLLARDHKHLLRGELSLFSKGMQ